MHSDEELQSARDRAVQRLLGLPGVTAVGIGGREVGGRATGEVVLRVYVEAKRPLEALSPDEVIPADIDGVPTDVAEMGRGRRLVNTPARPQAPDSYADDDRRRPLIGGSRLSSDLFASGWGSLGCFLVQQSDHTKAYGLTNWHVLQGHDSDPTPGKTRAGTPSAKDSVTKCCSNIIGTVAGGGDDSARDVGIVRLDAGMAWVAEIVDIGPVRGQHDVTGAEAGTHTYQVRKRGARSRLTGGTVDSIGAVVTLDTGAQMHNTTIVKPNPDPTVATGTSLYFVQEGDSGSVVVNDANEVIGLVFAGVFTGSTLGYGWALPIAGVLSGLQAHESLALAVATASAPNQVNTVPGTAMVAVPPELVPGLAQAPVPQPVPTARRAGAPLRLPAAAPWLPHIPPPPATALARLQADLDLSAAGRLLTAVWLAHQGELTTLVNTNRRVAAGWHRLGGSALLQLFTRMLGQPALALPPTVNGLPVAHCLDRAQELFARFGSQRLRADLDRARRALPEVGGLTYRQIIDSLGADPAGA